VAHYSTSVGEKLSEKGFEHRSECELSWHKEGEMDRKASLWRPTGLRFKRVRDFSDSFVKLSEKG
jgi:hypothetical protein